MNPEWIEFALRGAVVFFLALLCSLFARRAATRSALLAGSRMPALAGTVSLAAIYFLVATLHATSPAQAKDDKAEAGTVLTVGPTGCDHTTIQAALDAAPDNAQIQIMAGTFQGPLSIRKPVTLKGAGWDKTRVEMAYEAERGGPSVAHVADTQDVAFQDLHLGATTTAPGDRTAGATVLLIERANVRIHRCAILPAPSHGVEINGDSDVEMASCLVAAARGTGIAIGRRGAGMPRVRVASCDIRYGNQRGITIGTACNDVVIEGCRISGSGWHGIRYDNASPTVINNRIIHNVRSGIYASGRTRATVKGNLLADTGISGMSCWQQNGDQIHRNTFARNKREGLAILGESAPEVTENLFVESPIAVRWSGIAGGAPSGGLGIVRDNSFWKNEALASRELPTDAGNREEDPSMGTDDVLPAEVAARGRGASALPPAVSPFPIQPEEAEAKERYDRHVARQQAAAAPPPLIPSGDRLDPREARRISQSWLKSVRSLADAAARERALGEIRDAVSGDDATRRLAALQAAAWLGSIQYDRDDLRKRILPLASSDDAITRAAARQALVRVKPDPAVDLPMWIEEAQRADRSTAEQTARNLVTLGDRKVQGKVAEAVLHLLRDGADIKKAFVMRGLSRATVFDPRVSDRMIEIVRSVPAQDYDSAYYFHFITPRMDPKPDAVVDLILERAAAGEGSLDTMLRGLRTGLSDTQRKRAAKRLFEFLDNADTDHHVRYVLDALPSVVDLADTERLAALRASEKFTKFRHLIDDAIRATQRRAQQRAPTGASVAVRRKAYELSREWLKTIQSLKDRAAREAALQDLSEAVSGDDEARRLGALFAAAWLGQTKFDRDDLRARILPHASSEDLVLRRAAREALVQVKADPAVDLPMWLDEARIADRSTAERTALNLVKLAEGKVEGPVADAVLFLLRDGTNIKKAFVVRGLQSFKVLDPRVSDRMIAIVRSVAPSDYDSGYYFHFITPHMNPKPDAVVDVILDRAEEGKASLDTILRGLRVGLTDAQRKRAADRLLVLAENAGSEYAVVAVLRELASLVDASHVKQLEALAAVEDTSDAVKALIQKALENARNR